jgi:hypothetical protein
VWSACRWEIRTRCACAACEGGTGPRTRRRWPTRAVRTGSKRTVVPASSQVLVLCPHQVSVPVMARPFRPARWKWADRVRRTSRAAAVASTSARPDSRCRAAIWADGMRSRLSAFCARVFCSADVRAPQAPRYCHSLKPLQHPLGHDQIRVSPAWQWRRCVKVPRCLAGC